MGTASQVLVVGLTVYLLLLILRWICELVLQFARSYHPRGVMLVVMEATYTVTDPPLKFLRRFLPPLRLGSIALDVSFMILMVIVVILIRLAGSL